MDYTLITIIVVIGTLLSIIFGVIRGNKDLFKKYNQGFSGTFLIWMVLKNSVIHFFVFVIVTGILSMFLEEIWLYFAFLIYIIANFFIIKNKVNDEFDILLKPGSGILTPEGREKMKREKENNENNFIEEE